MTTDDDKKKLANFRAARHEMELFLSESKSSGSMGTSVAASRGLLFAITAIRVGGQNATLDNVLASVREIWASIEKFESDSGDPE